MSLAHACNGMDNEKPTVSCKSNVVWPAEVPNCRYYSEYHQMPQPKELNDFVAVPVLVSLLMIWKIGKTLGNTSIKKIMMMN